MRKSSKFIVVAGAIAALAVPSAAMASQPAKPGGFGQDRAWALTTAVTAEGHGWTDDPGASEMGIAASQRAGSNGTINNTWKVTNGELPVESNAGL